MRVKALLNLLVLAAILLLNAGVSAQEVFIGNPGKSLNFFHFDLALEKGTSRDWDSM